MWSLIADTVSITHTQKSSCLMKRPAGAICRDMATCIRLHVHVLYYDMYSKRKWFAGKLIYISKPQLPTKYCVVFINLTALVATAYLDLHVYDNREESPTHKTNTHEFQSCIKKRWKFWVWYVYTCTIIFRLCMLLLNKHIIQHTSKFDIVRTC